MSQYEFSIKTLEIIIVLCTHNFNSTYCKSNSHKNSTNNANNNNDGNGEVNLVFRTLNLAYHCSKPVQ